MGDKSEILEITVTSEVTTPEVKVSKNKSMATVSNNEATVPSFVVEDKIKTGYVPFSFWRFHLAYCDPQYKNEKYPALATKVPLFNYLAKDIDRAGYLCIYYEQQGEKQSNRNKYDIYKIYVSGDKPAKFSLIDEDSGEELSKKVLNINFHKEDIAWIAYSENSWSYKYLKKVVKDKNNLKTRFQKLDVADYIVKCNQSYQKGEQYGVAIEDDPENSGYSLFYYYSLYNVSVVAKSNNKKEDSSKEKEEELPFDYFFALHDPMGAVDDIIARIQFKMYEYESFVNSLHLPVENENPSTQESKEYEALYQSALLLNSLFYSNDTANDERLKKYRDIISYKRVSGILGLKERKDMANHIRGHLFIGELIREKGYRDGLRDALGVLIFSNYYQSILCDVNRADNHSLSVAQARRTYHLEGLLIDPADIECFYDINYKVPENKWKNFIGNSLPRDVKETAVAIKYVDNNAPLQNSVKEILRKDPVIDLSTDLSTIYAIGLSFQSMATLHVESFANVVVNQTRQLAALKSDNIWLTNKNAAINKTIANIESTRGTYAQYVTNGSKRGISATPSGAGGSPFGPKLVSEEAFSKIKERSYSTQSNLRRGHITAENIKVNYDAIKPHNEQCRRIVDHPAYNGIFFGLNILNMISVGVQITNHYGSESSEKNMEAWELWSYAIASTLQLGSASFGLSSLSTIPRFATSTTLTKLAAANVSIAENIATEIDKQLNKLGIIKDKGLFTKMVSRGMTTSVGLGLGGSTVFSLISLYKGIEQYNHNNEKAGIANFIVGTAGLLNVIFTVVSFSSVSAAATIAAINIILFAIVIIASIAAALLYLDFIQSFLTCTVFNSKKKTSVDLSYHSSSFRWGLYGERKDLTEKYTREEMNSYKRAIPMSDFRYAQEWLINLLVDIRGKCKLTGYEKHAYQDKLYYYPSSVNYQFRFRYFDANCLLEVHLVIYHKGLEQRTSQIIVPSVSHDSVWHDKDGFFNIDHRFIVGDEIYKLLKKQEESSETEISLHSCSYILFARIINTGKSEMNFPYCPDDLHRFVAFHERLFITDPRYHFSKYDGQIRAQSGFTEKNYYSLNDKSVLIGTKDEIYEQIRPLIIQ